jgi:hypothetical protein
MMLVLSPCRPPLHERVGGRRDIVVAASVAPTCLHGHRARGAPPRVPAPAPTKSSSLTPAEEGRHYPSLVAGVKALTRRRMGFLLQAPEMEGGHLSLLLRAMGRGSPGQAQRLVDDNAHCATGRGNRYDAKCWREMSPTIQGAKSTRTTWGRSHAWKTRRR